MIEDPRPEEFQYTSPEIVDDESIDVPEDQTEDERPSEWQYDEQDTEHEAGDSEAAKTTAAQTDKLKIRIAQIRAKYTQPCDVLESELCRFFELAVAENVLVVTYDAASEGQREAIRTLLFLSADDVSAGGTTSTSELAEQMQDMLSVVCGDDVSAKSDTIEKYFGFEQQTQTAMRMAGELRSGIPLSEQTVVVDAQGNVRRPDTETSSVIRKIWGKLFHLIKKG
jgi:hypothetical protein